METAILYTNLISETQFRHLAGLCEACGQARVAEKSFMCEECSNRIEVAAMENQWREWGIAA